MALVLYTVISSNEHGTEDRAMATATQKKIYCSWDGPKRMQKGMVYAICARCEGAIGIGQWRICRKRRKAQPRRQEVVLIEYR